MSTELTLAHAVSDFILELTGYKPPLTVCYSFADLVVLAAAAENKPLLFEVTP